MISTAIDVTRVSRVIGYKLTAGFFGIATPYLPQRIAVFGEANTANQQTIDEDPLEFTNADEVGAKYGYGSPLHQIARVLRPKFGDMLGGIATVVYPQKESGGETATEIETSLAFTGTEAQANETHYLIINGRRHIDGQSYSIGIAKGDENDDIIDKAVDAVNSVIGAPVTAEATGTAGSLNMTLTSKWKGVTSAEVTVGVDVGQNKAGITWSPESSRTDGAGEQNVSDTLAKFGDTWNTVVINPYSRTDVFAEFETVNGVPDPLNPTGRYDPKVYKPFVALFGNTNTSRTDVTDITGIEARKDQVTNVLCPAPGSDGFTWEAAANMAVVATPIMQNFPHLSPSGYGYFDMPVSSDIGDFGNYNDRDIMARNGASTVTLKNGQYVIQDFITTYHPDGEQPPKWRFVRDLNVDWNVGFGWLIIMDRDIQDRAIVPDDSPASVTGTISPSQAKQLVISYVTLMAQRALIADVDFSTDSIKTGINEQNPARLDIFFKYKRTSTAHQVATDATVDFFFSS